MTIKCKFTGLASGKYNKPFGATFTDDPIPPQFVHLFHSSQEKQNCTMVQTFLKQQERRIENVLGDGNCLFRAISFAVYHNQDMHTKVRIDISEIIRNNKQKFKPFITGSQSIDARVSNMSKSGIWGTQVELIAAATLYNIPVYVASRSTDGLSYHWRKYTPIAVDNVVIIETDKTHIELVHLNNCHFDPVVSTSGRVSEPIIPHKIYQGGFVE